MLLIASSQSPTVNKPERESSLEYHTFGKKTDYTIGQTTICFSLQVENRKLMRPQKFR